MTATGQRQFAAALFDPGGMPPGIKTARGIADPKRFAIYRNNVAVALIKAIESRFPVTRRIVGDDFFRTMAHAFITEHKPRSPLIFEYGDELPEFIETFAPARSLPYLADVARLEAAWTRAYHAAEAPVLAATDLVAVTDDLPGQSLVAHPSSSLIACAYPAGTIWAANQQTEVPPIRVSGAEAILIVRPHGEVHVHVLPAQGALFAQRLLAGHTLDEAGQEALSRSEHFDFGTALLGLVSLGAFTAIQFGRTR